MNCSDSYFNGTLLKENDIVVFRVQDDKERALEALKNANIVFEHRKDKVLVIDDFVGLRKLLSKYEGKELSIGIKKAKTRRSTQQLRFYFGVIVQSIQVFLKETTGESYTKEQIHLDNLLNIWGWKPEVETVNGREIIDMNKAPSTGRMSVQDFSKFIELIELDYRHKGLDFPEYKEDSNNNINDYVNER